MEVADNARKVHLGASLNRIGMDRAIDQIKLTGKALPCSVVSRKGSIVQVKFEVDGGPFTLPNVTIPHFGPTYLRYPTQIGDLGVTVAADAHLSGISGLGGGTADLSAPGNLAALYFMPVANKDWFATDPDAFFAHGKNGVVLQDSAGKVVYTHTPTGIVIAIGSTKLTFNSSSFQVEIGSTKFTFSASGAQVAGGDVHADSISLKTHRNTGVRSGSDTSGPPV